jgi:hypothetical protein
MCCIYLWRKAREVGTGGNHADLSASEARSWRPRSIRASTNPFETENNYHQH